MVDDLGPEYAMLSAQRALLGEVTAELRAVSIKAHGTTVTLTVTYDGETDGSLREIASCVATEVIADFPHPWTIEERCRFRSFPAPAYEPDDGILVFCRREELVETPTPPAEA